MGVDSFANGTSSVYMDQMYEDWQRDPNSVHASWRAYFGNVEGGADVPYSSAPS
jgi:2-oxoglutarate dehydrogenase E1 component